MARLNLNQVLAIALIGATVFNAYQHFTHPAYKYYVDNFRKLREDFDAFKTRVSLEFVPAISNSFASAAQVSISNQVLLISRTQKGIFSPANSPANQEKSKPPNFKFRRYFEISGTRFVMLGDTWYKEGDVVLGLPILGITPDVVNVGGNYYDVQKN